ncbi:chemotaxis protein CheW [Acidisoma cellulosilytica]|uniref:Chemotaxis protein CheW n=1 Tax=Acidisoma cellulosilyticum TaxID=2802395 RepID=A0A964E338_9PROT|nr:chemotaxis protein CheW [Acidisoma cellulosilyticum]MCB8879959.1 chemotaxis protein CheW [Acidisoma cellulosilyticum]
MSATALPMPDSPAAIPVLLIRVAGQAMAVRQRDIAEILPLPRLAAVPEAPPILAGAFSLGGTAVFVLPMSHLLALAGPAEGTALYHHLLLLPAQRGEARFALRVDRVTDIVLAEPQPLPKGESFNDCVEAEIGQGGGLLPLLSVSRLITVYERERLQAFALRDSTRAAIFRPGEPG